MNTYNEIEIFGYEIPKSRMATASEVEALQKIGRAQYDEALLAHPEIAAELNNIGSVEDEIAQRDYSEAEPVQGDIAAGFIYACTQTESRQANASRRYHGIEDILFNGDGRSRTGSGERLPNRRQTAKELRAAKRAARDANTARIKAMRL